MKKLIKKNGGYRVKDEKGDEQRICKADKAEMNYIACPKG